MLDKITRSTDTERKQGVVIIFFHLSLKEIEFKLSKPLLACIPVSNNQETSSFFFTFHFLNVGMNWNFSYRISTMLHDIRNWSNNYLIDPSEAETG